MSEYTPPLNDIRYTMRELSALCLADAGLKDASLAALPGYEDATDDVIAAILDEAGRLASDVLAPLNRPGDLAGCQLENGVVRTPDGFKEAYGQLAGDGWTGMLASREYGGQGLPNQVAYAAFELWTSANMAFGLIPLLGLSAIELLQTYGTAEQKEVYMRRLISGEWTSTMELTEPQAGSDLGRLTTRAVPDGDHYRLTGQKIFITGGEHDWTGNIIHMVLARLPGAPEGSRGISLFLVPKFLVNGDGSLGLRNDLRCVSLEDKLGIHASPTCVMSYGDNDGAVGYLVGGEHKGLAAMFTMMNLSRLTVGIQGVGVGERAYQQALAYARERIQGSRKTEDGGRRAVPIIEHPDVKRMLLSMKSLTEAHRAVALYTALCADLAQRHPEADMRAKFDARLSLLTPIVKAWITDGAIEVANLGIQVHGGAGFIEETGAAQHLRDARITAIYEGTNGIQAGDLVGRKILGDGGAAITGLIADMKAAPGISGGGTDALARARAAQGQALEGLEAATRWLLDQGPGDEALVVSHPYLTLLGNVLGGWMLSLTAASAAADLEAPGGDTAFLEGKILSARHFGQERLSMSPSLAARVMGGGDGAAAAMAHHFQRF